MKNQMEEIPKYRLVLLGDASVGKTTILTNFMYQKFDTHYQPTVGIDFFSKTIYLKDKAIRLQMWDTSGCERFRSLIPIYLKDSSVALIVYDVTNRKSFLNAELWIEEVRNLCGTDVIVALVGNKSDLLEQRQVATEEGEFKARALGVMFTETSAKVGFNIKPLFWKIAPQLPGMDTLSSTKQEDSQAAGHKDKTVESLKRQVADGFEILMKRLDEEKSARMSAQKELEGLKQIHQQHSDTLQAKEDEIFSLSKRNEVLEAFLNTAKAEVEQTKKKADELR